MHRRQQFNYDWDNWLNGEAWELELGKDYGDLTTLRSAASQKAFREGVRVTINKLYTDGPERVVLQRIEAT